MILVGLSPWKIAIGVLCVSLAILILIIAYKKLLAFMNKGAINQEKYVVLNRLENHPSFGELEFYFTCEEPKNVVFSILNEDSSLNRVLVSQEYQAGGNIIRFDSTLLENGSYFYQLETDNQKTMKKMEIYN